MKCNRCGNPLPNRGVVCNFCGMLMSQDQVNTINKEASKEVKQVELLSEKYGRHQERDYSSNIKENKPLGVALIIIILLFLIILTILINVIR